MKREVIVLFAAVALLAPSATFAAMPNYTGDGYKQPQDCLIPPDNGIYEIVDGLLQLTGCNPAAAVARSVAAAAEAQSGVHFKVNETLNLTTGSFTCPWYYVEAAGCAVAKKFVR